MTQIIHADKLIEAAQCIKNGGTVAFPTETVYGLGCDAFNPAAIDKVYKAKGRPSDNPLIVHISNRNDVSKLAQTVSESAVKIMDAFWPGPLTVILKKRPEVPIRVTGGLDTVAIRLPADELARKLIEESKTFIAAPSANLSGSPSPTTAKHVADDLYGRIDYILAGDDSKIGLESTVVDMTSEIPVILRPGAITKEMLSAVLSDVIYDPAFTNSADKPKSPGMKYKHYSPKAPIEVIIGDKEKVTSYIEDSLKTHPNSGVLSFYGVDYDDAVCVLSAGTTMEDYASSLFYNLRVFDEYKVSKIFAEFVEIDGIGVAVKNRLFKAAGNNITIL